MKYAFSTLGCPEWPWQEILSTAKDLGFNGIELRGLGNEIYAPKIKLFSEEHMESTQSSLKRLGLEIPCITSASYLFDERNFDEAIKEGKDYIDLAASLRSPYIRVLGDKNPEPGDYVDDELVRKGLKILGAYATGKNVTVLIESNGVYGDSNRLLHLVASIENPSVGVLWDIHHPYRFYGEAVSQTYANLKHYIKYVHVKDSVNDNGKIKYKMMGYGDVPVHEVINLLKNNNYTGYVSLEWVKRWNSELEEPGVVFSNFINFIK